MKPEIMRGLVTTGKVYDLGMEYFVGMPHYPTHPPFTFSLGRLHGDLPYEGGVASANCVFSTGGHTGTHMDAIGHISVRGAVFGVGDIRPWQSPSGLAAADISQVPPVVTRGVLLDVAGWAGLPCLSPEFCIDAQVLDAVSRAQGISIEPYDAVLLRTGWIRHFGDRRKYISHQEGCPGLVEDGALWLVEKKAGFVGADTAALERTPAPSLPVHGILLAQHGIHILEVLNLEELASDGVYGFLFVASPLKIRGGTGSPIRPIAIC